MPLTLSSVAAKDGTTAPVPGGFLAADKAGGGVGPFIMAHLLVDGVAGTNLAAVDSSNRLKTLPEGGVASGVADSGNPLKIGGVYNSSAPILTNGQRGDAQLDANANLKVAPVALSLAQGSTTSGQTGPLIQGAVSTAAPSYTTAQTSPLSLDTSGGLRVSGVSGTVASGAADSGNPVKVGGRNNSTLPTLTDGQRGDVQLDVRGNTRTTISDGGGTNLIAVTSQGDGSNNSINQLFVAARGSVFNGTTWDRLYAPGVGTSPLTRPSGTPTYSAAAIVASSGTPGSIVVPNFAVATNRRLVGARLKSNHTTGLDLKQFRVRLFTTTAPTFTNGDTGAYALATGAANYVGKFEFTMEQWADGAFGAAAPFDRPEILLPAATYYWDLQTIDGFVAQASKTFTFEPEFVS